MIGRTLSEEGAAALRARFLVSNPQTPQEMLTAALGTTAPVDLGRGLTLTRRRVAGEMRLELSGADRGMIEGLKPSAASPRSSPSNCGCSCRMGTGSTREAFWPGSWGREPPERQSKPPEKPKQALGGASQIGDLTGLRSPPNSDKRTDP